MASERSRIKRLQERADARSIRDDEALRLYASGKTINEITLALADQFGTSRLSASNTGEMIKRALRRHAAAINPQTVDLARARLLSHLEALLTAWLPLALGGQDPNTLEARAPSDKAASVVLQTLDRIGNITGAIRPPEKNTNITVNVTPPSDAQSKRDHALQQLRREADKMLVIEGELSNAGTNLANTQAGDRPADRIPAPREST